MFHHPASFKITSAAEKKLESLPVSRISPTKIIVFGYLAIIAAGTLLLMFPVSTRVGIVTPLVLQVWLCSIRILTGRCSGSLLFWR